MVLFARAVTLEAGGAVFARVVCTAGNACGQFWRSAGEAAREPGFPHAPTLQRCPRVGLPPTTAGTDAATASPGGVCGAAGAGVRAHAGSGACGGGALAAAVLDGGFVAAFGRVAPTALAGSRLRNARGASSPSDAAKFRLQRRSSFYSCSA